MDREREVEREVERWRREREVERWRREGGGQGEGGGEVEEREVEGGGEER